ncbi:MAG: hypothetical protein IPP07_09760 [Holophagales bacterium]|nr:hypothetical protein [Holophagales bacterium]
MDPKVARSAPTDALPADAARAAHQEAGAMTPTSNKGGLGHFCEAADALAAAARSAMPAGTY